MPGRTPAEAVRAFLDPLREALACVADGVINCRQGGLNPKVDAPQQWSINNGGGAPLLIDRSGELRLYASMWWKLIRDDRPDYGPYRVTTTGYDYNVVGDDEVELWALHWHPTGPSPERTPHLHLGDVVLAADAPVSSKSHLPTGRMTFETAIRWTMQFGGAEPLKVDWDDRLTLAETPHLLHRSWR